MKKILFPALSVAFLMTLSACKNATPPQNTAAKTNETPVLISAERFDSTISGKKTALLTLKNAAGTIAQLTNYGGRLVSLLIADKNGKPTDVIVGPGSIAGFLASKEPYFGATIGRYGNRIARGRFSIDGKTYSIATNNAPNTLHGGVEGFQAVVWDYALVGDSTVIFSYLSKDGEEGFPGNLAVKVTYTLTHDDAFLMTYEAKTDKKTPVNLTNHAFFNLNGCGSGTINNHTLQVMAAHFTPVDSTLIPTGEIAAVDNTPFDFRQPVTIGSRLEMPNPQLKYGGGYDHNFVLSRKNGEPMSLVATAKGDKTGITLEVYTEEPGLQFYGGNFMSRQNTLKVGVDDPRTAFCLETQHFPDSPNQPKFPTTILQPNQLYKTTSVYKFKR